MAIDTLGANALASDSVTTAKIVDDAVTSAKIPAGAVVAADVADGSITTAKLADDAVTGGKLANDISISTTGNIATTGSGTITSAGLITASGSVAVGGTGAANTLDDYEEGTWTPAMDASTTSPNSITTGEGYYTKIGNQVIAFGNLLNINRSGAAGNARITGLPFPIQSSISGGQVPGSLYGNQLLIGGLSSAEYTIVEGVTGTSYLQIRLIRNGNTNASVMTLTSTYFTDDQTDIRFQITYRTGA